MRILLTGSSGWLGQTLAPRLKALGHQVTGLDPVAAAHTTIIGSVADRGTVRSALRDGRFEAIIHAGGLHKPDIDRNSRDAFMAVNVQGTFNLLEEAVEQAVQRFVFTSTTSLMISSAIRAGRAGGMREAAWLTEAMPPEPRNIYGVTKLAA
ncbi:MAG: NAD-dependent epimerase/dehydratase family protein, partial [Phreatobacter sp.]